MRPRQPDGPRALVLGSGTSTGVPLIGCHCAVCDSPDLRDNRLRSGVYVTAGNFAVQLDVSPDFRQQALRFGIEQVNVLLVTHPHADHVLGLDEIRRFNTLQNSRIQAYARDFTLSGIGRIFSYIVTPSPEQETLYRPQIDFVEIDDGPLEIGPFTLTSLEIPHGPTRSTAFKLVWNNRSFVYAPDCSQVTPAFQSFIQGADVVLLDGLRDRYHPSHLTFDDSVAAMRASGVGRGYVTHIGHDILHAELEKKFPDNIKPAYDGLEIEW